jgi:hypothetical protein
MAISKGFYSPKKRTILDVLDIDFHPWLLFEFTTAIVSFIKRKKENGVNSNTGTSTSDCPLGQAMR